MTVHIVLETRDLRKHFPLGDGRTLKAVDGISLHVERGETLALVGESGSGKTTFGRTVLRLEAPTSGAILLEDNDISRLGGKELRAVYLRAQMVFQNPLTSLSPRFSILETITESMKRTTAMTEKERVERARELMLRVNLRPELLSRLPHELSGGQRQRIGIARAIALNPALIVADEPTASLDVTTQAQIVNLLLQLQRETEMACLFITHHLGLARHLAHRTAVMYLGRIVETGSNSDLFGLPRHPYTIALLSTLNAKRPMVLEGGPPSAVTPPAGCHFAPRCPLATAVCREHYPPLVQAGAGHSVACHHAEATGDLRKVSLS